MSSNPKVILTPLSEAQSTADGPKVKRITTINHGKATVVVQGGCAQVHHANVELGREIAQLPPGPRFLEFLKRILTSKCQ